MRRGRSGNVNFMMSRWFGDVGIGTPDLLRVG